MKYQISYLSPSGHAEQLADAFSRLLPTDTAVTDLNEESVVCGDVHLVGFEIDGSKPGAGPYKVMDFLEQLDGKTLFLFVTSPLYVSEHWKKRNENILCAFIPDHCDFRGIYMCQGAASEEFLEELREIATWHAEESWVRDWLEQCHHAEGHPDQDDILQGCRVMMEALELNRI